MAVPVIVGSLGRIPVGALTDRLGARRMFPTVQLAAAFAPSFPFDLIGGLIPAAGDGPGLRDYSLGYTAAAAGALTTTAVHRRVERAPA